MAFKVFLDANCLLDLTLKRSGFPQAETVMQLGIAGEIELFTTPAVLNIVSYYTTDSYDKTVARQIITALLNDIYIIDCTHTTAVTAAKSTIDDLEDALQYYAALHHDLNYFISGDKKLKKNALPQLPVHTSKELIALLM